MKNENGGYKLVEVPKEQEEIIVVKDTSKVSEYILEYFTKDKKIESRGLIEWREVVCQNKLSKRFVKQIQQSLSKHNCYTGKIDGLFTSEAKKGLRKFQKTNNLPLGQVDIETIEALNLFMPK